MGLVDSLPSASVAGAGTVVLVKGTGKFHVSNGSAWTEQKLVATSSADKIALSTTIVDDSTVAVASKAVYTLQNTLEEQIRQVEESIPDDTVTTAQMNTAAGEAKTSAVSESKSYTDTQLGSYYKKTEIDSEVAALENKISAIPKFTMSVVSSLPSTGDSATLYIVGTAGSDSAKEYIYVNGAWELIGDIRISVADAVAENNGNPVSSGAVYTALQDYLPLNGKAKDSEKADHATSADTATTATNATTAGSATKATQDASGNVITSTYATKSELSGEVSSLNSAINTLSTAVSTLEGKVENLEGEVSTAKSYLTVTVTSATGNVTGRVITATPSEGSADTTATVGSGGSVTMTLNATSQYTVGCDAPEGYYAVSSQTITTATAGLVTNLTFTLVRKPVVNVVVTDTSNSGYQNGRTISVTGVESATLTTDSAGKTSYTFSKTGSVTFAMTNIPTDGDCDPVTVTLENDKTHEVAMEISFGFVVGVRVKLSDGTVEYTDDAVGFTAASGTNLGSWVGHKLLEGFKPVQRSSAGAFTDLNPNDLTQTASGGVSSITSTVADAFLEVPLTWMHLSKDSTYGYIKFSNRQVDSSYTANAFYGSDGALKNCFHYGLFFSTNKSNKAYCFGGGAPTGSVSLTNWITYSQSRGEFFDLTTGCMDTFLIAMFVVLYKSLNGQTALAKGYTGGSSVQNNTILTFTSNNYGMAGSTSSDTTRMAFLWIHDFWGNMYQWVGGMSSNSSYKCCIQVGQLCTASNVDMNSTDIGPSSSVSGYLSSVAFDNDAGFYPLAANGSETALFADYGLVYASYFPYRGGGYNGGGLAGPFYLRVYNGASNTYSYVGARLSYRGGRA